MAESPKRPADVSRAGVSRVVKPAKSGDPTNETARAADSVPLAVGPFTVLPTQFGRYRIERLLGRGAMGAVYLAHDIQLDRSVALKVARVSNAGSAKLIKRMETEAKAAAKIDHDLICKVYDFGEIDGMRFIAQQYIEGEDLKSHLKRVGVKRKPEEAIRWIVRLAAALEAAHEKGVIHRDLKPENIILNRRNEPVIMDFGLARNLTGSTNAGLTQGMILGTAAYMSPEQAIGKADGIDYRSDLYALGVMLFEMLTGEWPFTGSAIEVLGQKVVQEAPSPLNINPNLPPQLVAVCQKMIAQKKEDRYATCAEMIAALESLDLNPSAPLEIKVETSEACSPLAFQVGSSFDFLDHVPAATPADFSTQVGKKVNPAKKKMSPLVQIPFLPWWRDQPTPFRWTILGAFATCLMVLAVTLFFRRGDALVKVEVLTDDVEVTFQNNAITVTDGVHEYKIKPGEHRLHIKVGNVEFDTEMFRLKQGENPILTVELVKSEIVAKIGDTEVGRRSLSTSISGESKIRSSSPSPVIPEGMSEKRRDDSELPTDELFYVLAKGGLANVRFYGQTPKPLNVDIRIPIASMNWNSETQSLLVLSENRFLSITTTGAEPKELYRLPESAYTGAIHRSKDRLAWCRRRSSGHSEVIVSKIDGTEETLHEDGYDPIWTSDGQNLIYTSWHDSAWGIGVHDGIQTRYLKIPAHPSVTVFPSPSPDGKQIAFAMKATDGTMQIGLMSIDGGDVRQLTHVGDGNSFSTFSPDGRSIAFIRGFPSPASLVIVDIKTGKETIVASDVSPVRPVWHSVISGDKDPPSTIAKETATSGIKNGDFSDGLNGWQKEGNAADFKVYSLPSGANYMTTHNGRYDARGRLFQIFEVPRDATQLQFYVHGGDSPNMSVGLIDNGKSVYRVSGKNTNEWSPVSWDVSNFRGKQVTLEIVDQLARPAWGHFGAYGFKIHRENSEVAIPATDVRRAGETVTRKNDYDSIANGKWVRLLDGSTTLPDTQRNKFVNGVLELNATSLLFERVSARNVILRAQVRKISGQNLSLAVRESQPLHFYGGWFNGENWFGIGKRGKAPWTNFDSGRIGPPKNDFFEMAVSAVDDKITLYVDGKAIYSAKDSEHDRGVIRLGALNGISLFKDVEVMILDAK